MLFRLLVSDRPGRPVNSGFPEQNTKINRRKKKQKQKPVTMGTLNFFLFINQIVGIYLPLV